MKQNIKHFMLAGLLCLSASAFAQVHTKNKDNPKTPDLTLNLRAIPHDGAFNKY
ncbi:hypothetical protein [Mucilaginibacter flavidus]|uniref:hypothetical protein n=1 Tax=Mucilaginibacter flavidus TaxID=2949309 RepID=UPI0020937AA8|nr:hypothetical protein [Mucilaginibacter flavidus]MCO5947177.1 hypothetical protein [Mucilaginibacter flavidus]